MPGRPPPTSVAPIHCPTSPALVSPAFCKTPDSWCLPSCPLPPAPSPPKDPSPAHPGWALCTSASSPAHVFILLMSHVPSLSPCCWSGSSVYTDTHSTRHTDAHSPLRDTQLHCGYRCTRAPHSGWGTTRHMQGATRRTRQVRSTAHSTPPATITLSDSQNW